MDDAAFSWDNGNVSPVKPSDFEALIVNENDSICSGLISLLKLSYLWFKLVRWFLDSDGFITTEFATALCGIECEGESGTPGSSV